MSKTILSALEKNFVGEYPKEVALSESKRFNESDYSKYNRKQKICFKTDILHTTLEDTPQPIYRELKEGHLWVISVDQDPSSMYLRSVSFEAAIVTE